MRYLGASQAQIEIAAPRLAAWLGHVFLVLGGYIAATGILTMALAATAYREHRRTAAIAALLGGAASIGLMTAVNFAIASDFKWVLSGIAALWACSIACYGIEILRGRGARSRTEDHHATGLSGGLLGYERKYSRAVTLDASADEVFAFADDFTRLSSHMGQSSAMMMGSSMQTSFDESRGQAVGSHVRMTGKMLGIELFLDEVVREREPPRHKAWETVGTPRLLIIGGYRLGLISPRSANARSCRSSSVTTCRPSRHSACSAASSAVYAKWCVRQMVDGAAASFPAQRGGSPKA